METVKSADGTSIGYAKSGSGPPLLLVHGTTADHRRWTPILPYFEPSFTVYAMDRRGRGGSGNAPQYDILREAEDVAAVVEAVGEPVSVLGHSFGALCSLEAALLTNKMRRLILYEPPIPTGTQFYPPGILDRIQAQIDRDEYEAAVELFFREIVRMPEREFDAYRQLPVWPVRVSLAPTLVRESLYDHAYTLVPERFAGLHVPTLLLVGGDSSSYMRDGTAAVHAALPNSQVVVLPGQQHIAMDTDPELFTREVLEFLLD
jgi:pimeloyl-ACP methyl ester carboxylesterase